MRFLRLLTLIAVFSWISVAHASVPAQINYQGRLTDQNGIALQGLKTITFQLWTLDGSTMVWSVVQNITLTDGFFSTVLSGGTPALSSIDFSTQYNLAVIVDGAEVLPRQQFNSVPYAIRSDAATRADVAGIPVVLNGTIDVSQNEGGRVYFKLDRAPAKIELFMKGEQLNPLFYTEVGAHNHGVSATHTHTVTLGSHDHGIWHDHQGYPVSTAASGGTSSDNPTIIVATDLGTKTTSANSPGSTDSVGLMPSGAALHTGAAYTYFNNMRFFIDGADKTSNVLALTGWTALGDGTSTHAFSANGTGFLDITSFTTWTVGVHYLTFGCTVGGRINYTLYIYY